MAKYFARQYLRFDAFRQGEDQTVRADGYTKFSTLSEWQKNRELDVSGRYAADLTAICDGNAVQGVMMQIFDMHDKSSTLFALDTKNGVIDWEGLRAMTHMYMHDTLQQGHIELSDVDVTIIHKPNKFAEKIAAKVCENAELTARDGFHFRAETARFFDESKASTEALRIQEALQKASHVLPKNVAQDILMARMEMASQLSQPSEIMSWKCASLSDRVSLETREAWTGHFAEIQQQPDVTFNQALWLSGLKAVTPIMAEISGQLQDEPGCTKEDEAVFTFLQADLVEQAEKAGCSKQDIAEAMNYAIQIHAAHYRPKPDGMIAAAFANVVRQTTTESAVHFNGAWNMYPDISKIVKQHLTGDPHISPAQDFRMALMKATPEIEKMMRDTYGVKEPKVPDMNAVYTEMDKMRAGSTMWTRYAEHALAELPRDQAPEFLKLYQHNITMANVASDITNTGTLALQMYKTMHEWTREHNVPIGQQMDMAGIRSDAVTDAMNNGISVAQLDAAMGRDDLGDNDISDDAF